MPAKSVYIYRLYPRKDEEEKLLKTLEICRQLYNQALAQRRDSWRLHKISINYYQQALELAKKKKQNPALNVIYSQVLVATLRRLDQTFENYFCELKKWRNGERKKKPGFPRFKSKSRFRSFVYPQFGFRINGSFLELSKIGKIKIVLHRPIEGKIKNLTIIRKADKWFAYFTVEKAVEVQPKETEKAIGVDLGLENFASLSSGMVVENPRYLRKSEARLKKEQRRLSRKKSNSSNREKQRLKVARAHLKIENQRRDFHHKLSRWLVNNYDLIALEKLNITAMVQNNHLSKSILDAGWGEFIHYVCYKAEWAGKQTVMIDPSGTTINCFRCGFPVHKELSERTHYCPNCGLKIHRDYNSSLNILARALPQGLGEVTPVEMGPLLKKLPLEQALSEKQEATNLNRW